MTINVAELSGITIRDLAELEGVIGRPIGALFAALGDGDMSGLDARTLAGLIWLRMRRDDPELTYEGVLDIDLGSLSAEEPTGEEVLQEALDVAMAPNGNRAERRGQARAARSPKASPGPIP